MHPLHCQPCEGMESLHAGPPPNRTLVPHAATFVMGCNPSCSNKGGVTSAVEVCGVPDLLRRGKAVMHVYSTTACMNLSFMRKPYFIFDFLFEFLDDGSGSTGDVREAARPACGANKQSEVKRDMDVEAARHL